MVQLQVFVMDKDVFFWHGMGKCIKDMCDSCSDCAMYQKTDPKEPMKYLPIPGLPWQIVSQDIFECLHNPYLITVCHRYKKSRVQKVAGTKSHEPFFATSRLLVPTNVKFQKFATFCTRDFFPLRFLVLAYFSPCNIFYI